MNINLLIQSTLIFIKYSEEDLKMVYTFMTEITDEQLEDYKCICSIMSYDNDLDLYIEIVKSLIKIYEEREDYEKCYILTQKLKKAITIKEYENI